MAIERKKLWIRPHYTKTVEHKLPDTNKKVKVKAGTQVIDRCWRHIKRSLEGRSSKVGSIVLKNRVRFA